MSSNTGIENSISFDLPKNQSNVIKVIGVGGGGSNAINHMFQQGIKGVDFVICNTDAQALQNSGVPNKIQLGVNLTEGLGAGANPEIGEKAAVESFEEISSMLDSNTKMVFITAGMGGGTGTGAAPIIAKMAKEMDILTVGIVTMPFQFEGKLRNQQAQKGIDNLRSMVDSLVVINNNKLREVYGNLGFKAGFSKADEVLSTAARGIAEVITHHYTQNIDLRDAKTVLSNSGTAIMGSAIASGQNRAHEAIRKALDSPLLNDNKITGAKNVLLLIVSGVQEITIDEIGEINDHIQDEAGHGANIIMGVGEDESLDESIAVTIIATGFDLDQQNEISNTEIKKVIHALEDDKPFEKDLTKKEKQPAIITPNIELKEEKKEEVVKHTLDIEELDDFQIKSDPSPKLNHSEEPSGLIKTNEEIKNIKVTYEEVTAEIEEEEDDYIITEIKPEAVEESYEDEYGEEEQQITLTFDLPISESPITSKDNDFVVHELDENVKKMPVRDFVEVIPVTESNEKGEVRYALDDYIEVESEMNPKKNEVVIEEQDVVFEKKTLKEDVDQGAESGGDIDPMNSPISDMLKERAEERRRKMKDFNYKFNTNKIDDIEKIPAYKRQGVDLNDTPHSSDSSSMSSTSISLDDNNDIQMRNNNSFLHDNVD
ncbi:cell division protein FtsZ [Mangrovimonas sp. AS39]|uniref:cell division protein FtsZ n=1 Tax=Mangrovimonas futianensis TaxID=2895523 RepID=UPI001E542ED0|nr:cell division protein FtsZ [Mangrovimonas futianensis]MCF1190832.1 cell division protein FtsZ [Mangrovimonas futianensis]MCF1194529.1 cell division protein FtsZ [Mangrovimonas futianensis]